MKKKHTHTHTLQQHQQHQCSRWKFDKQKHETIFFCALMQYSVYSPFTRCVINRFLCTFTQCTSSILIILWLYSRPNAICFPRTIFSVDVVMCTIVHICAVHMHTVKPHRKCHTINNEHEHFWKHGEKKNRTLFGGWTLVLKR